MNKKTSQILMQNLPGEKILSALSPCKAIPKNRNRQAEDRSFMKTEPRQEFPFPSQAQKNTHDHSRENETNRPLGQDA